MVVRAKFRVSSVISSDETGGTVTLFPVTTGSEENAEFYKQTPGGSITLSTINAEAAKQFKEGQEVYVDFTPIPEETQQQ